jgi:hypothetical protein
VEELLLNSLTSNGFIHTSSLSLIKYPARQDHRVLPISESKSNVFPHSKTPLTSQPLEWKTSIPSNEKTKAHSTLSEKVIRLQPNQWTDAYRSPSDLYKETEYLLNDLLSEKIGHIHFFV